VPAEPLGGEQHHPAVHRQRALAREAHRDRKAALAVGFTDQRANASLCSRGRLG
jgi:hypothetical protein